MRYFTQYWDNANCVWHEDNGFAGKPFEHTAGNLFVKKRINKGDRVYGVTNLHGQLCLIGALTVGQIVPSDKEARAILGYEPYSARDHLMAERKSATAISFKRIIPLSIVKQLRFVTKAGSTKIKFDYGTHIDPQTLRTVRELTKQSADLLESYLA